jgi:HSP20 family molecular chaperone IbpA
MSTTLTRWRDSIFAPFEPGGGLFPFVTPEIRIEQVMEEGKYVVRAEIPGVDPYQDIDVSVEQGVLIIRAERAEETRERTHSEFHYGRLMRTLTLPSGTKEETGTAKYANGILEISFILGEPKPAGRHIAIDITKQPKEPTKEVGSKIKK